MSQGRYLTEGTTEALFMLSRGHCYEPTCKRRVISWNGHEWRKDVHVAHIRGLKKNSPRHDETFPKPNHFSNLILLCKKHHDLVDHKPTGDAYTVEMLIQWKVEREDGLPDNLSEIDWLTEDKIQEYMSSAMTEMRQDILKAVDRIEGISQQTLDFLKVTLEESFNFLYLDPEAIASLERSTEIMNAVHEFIPMLHESAHNIRSLPDDALLLLNAADKLGALSDNAETLLIAANLLNASRLEEAINSVNLIDAAAASLKDSIGSINQASNSLTDALGTLPQMERVSGHLARAATLLPADFKRTAQHLAYGALAGAALVWILVVVVMHHK